MPFTTENARHLIRYLWRKHKMENHIEDRTRWSVDRFSIHKAMAFNDLGFSPRRLATVIEYLCILDYLEPASVDGEEVWFFTRKAENLMNPPVRPRNITNGQGRGIVYECQWDEEAGFYFIQENKY